MSRKNTGLSQCKHDKCQDQRDRGTEFWCQISSAKKFTQTGVPKNNFFAFIFCCTAISQSMACTSHAARHSEQYEDMPQSLRNPFALRSAHSHITRWLIDWLIDWLGKCCLDLSPVYLENRQRFCPFRLFRKIVAVLVVMLFSEEKEWKHPGRLCWMLQSIDWLAGNPH